jgi:hypothetical protein
LKTGEAAGAMAPAAFFLSGAAFLNPDKGSADLHENVIR